MPVSSRGPRRRRSWWCHTCSSTPSTRTPAKRAGFRCGLQARLDMGPHGVPRGCQLSGQSCDGGSFEAQLSDRPADRPGAQTRPGCAHLLAVLQECHRLADVFAAYPASLKPPDPHRDPGPGRVDHLHHHTPVALSDSAHNQGTPPADCTTQHRVPEHQGCEPRSSPSKPTSRSHRSQRSSDTQQQVGRDTTRGPVKIAEVEVRSSSMTSTSTRNPQPKPTHPHSTRKSHVSAGLTNGESMSMVINMPTKNIYVSEADMELFERAAQHADSVSAAVVQALQEYLTNRHNTERGYGRIELALYENGSRRKVMFYGREIVRVERPVDGGVQINTIYETAKGQLAVATKIRRLLPDEVKGSYRIWDHPETWSREFWLIGDKTLEVYPDIAQLELVDAYLAEQCKSALSAKPYEVLDI